MKIKLIPPVYFICGATIIIIAYSLFPLLNLIPFPYNLCGLLFIFGGYGLLSKAYRLFEKYQTPHNFDEGVQFHPEALLTEHGHALLKNFLQRGLQ